MMLFDWPSALNEGVKVIVLPASSVLSAAYLSVINLGIR
jgi:hypothetical protein